MVEWKTIDDISKNVFAGGTPSTKHEEYYDGDIPWIRSGEIDFNTITKAERNITKEGYNNSSAKLIRSGSVVMAMTGATVAKSAIVEFETSANQSVCAIETDESVANYKYVYFYLSKEYFKIKSSAQGALTSLNLSMIKQIEIPVPSLEEQTRIVGILDTFTSAIDNLKEQIAQRRKQYEYYRDQLLDLEGKPGVEMKTIGDFGDVTKLAGFEFTEHVIYKEEGKIIALRGLNVRNGNLDLSQIKYIDGSNFEKLGRSKLLINDMLFTYVGTIGNVALINEDDKYYLAPNVSRIRFDCNVIIPRFALYVFMSEYFHRTQINKFLNSSSMKNLSMENIRKFKLPLPPLSEQQRIVSILDTFEASIQNLEAQLKEREKQYEYYRNKLLTFE